MGREVMGARVGHLSYTRVEVCSARAVPVMGATLGSIISLYSSSLLTSRQAKKLFDPVRLARPHQTQKRNKKREEKILKKYQRSSFIPRPRYLFVSHDTNAAIQPAAIARSSFNSLFLTSFLTSSYIERESYSIV